MGALWSFMEYALGIDSNSYEVKKRSYADSNFRQLYKSTAKQQTVDSVIKGLKQLKNKSFAQTFAQLSKDGFKINVKDEDNDEEIELKEEERSVGEIAVRCWSIQTPKFYGALKGALLMDDKVELKKWMPFIRALNSELTMKQQPSKVCYRGSKMSLKDFSVFKKDFIYRIPYYIATSTDKEVAEKWPNQNYLIQFNVAKNCPNAASIKHLSKFPFEEEVLMPPYTAVRVVSKSDKLLVVDVLDNYYAPKEASAHVMEIKPEAAGTASNFIGLYGGLGGTGVGMGAVIGAAGGLAVVSSGMVGAKGSAIQDIDDQNKFVD